MNYISEANDLLKSGKWCTGELHDGDRHCAVGALGAVMFSQQEIIDRARSQWEYVPQTGEVDHEYLTDAEYIMVRGTREARVLAETIIEQNPEWYQSFKGSLDIYIEHGKWDNVILAFNDDQENPEPVIAMFDKAAVKMEEL